jgi:hypothetical protein
LKRRLSGKVQPLVKFDSALVSIYFPVVVRKKFQTAALSMS